MGKLYLINERTIDTILEKTIYGAYVGEDGTYEHYMVDEEHMMQLYAFTGNMQEDREIAHKNIRAIIEKYHGNQELTHEAMDTYLCYTLEFLGFEDTIREFRKQERWYA